jgi:hypothetical protein
MIKALYKFLEECQHIYWKRYLHEPFCQGQKIGKCLHRMVDTIEVRSIRHVITIHKICETVNFFVIIKKYKEQRIKKTIKNFISYKQNSSTKI